MRILYPLILLLLMSGCCRLTDRPPWTGGDDPDAPSKLYRFRIERTGATRFSGLLALKAGQDGIYTVLLDATGIPLVKEQVDRDGATRLEYCSPPLRDTRMPELLGKLVEYIYFIPASDDCPWYAVSCVCREADDQQTVKWKKLGPFRMWEVKQANTGESDGAKIVTLHFSALTAYLQPINAPAGK